MSRRAAGGPSAVGASAHPLRWLPNALTVARLLALPVLLWILIEADGPTSVTAGLLFGVVGLTDMLDGALARAMRAESTFGRIADPFADRLLVAVGLVGLILLDRMHWSAPGVLLLRDAVLVVGFLALARRGVEMRVDVIGKASSALTMVAAGGALLFAGLWVEVLLWVAVGLATISFVMYVAVASRAVGDRRRARAGGG